MRRLSQATAFHRYDFLSAVAPSLQCAFVPLVVYSGSQKVGVAPLLVRRYGPFCAINSGPLPYLGPLVPAALIPATLAALTAEARRRRALDHYQFFSPDDSPSPADGFRVHVDRTFVIPLRDRSDEDLLKAMNQGRRRELRQAERIGMRVSAAERADFQLMDAWNRQLYAVQGLRPVFPAGTYERVFTALSGTPGSSFYAARVDGRTVGVQVNLEASGRVFAWQYATDKSFKPCSPQSILMWHTAVQARDAGISELDLLGAPNDGIATYKSRWGAVGTRVPGHATACPVVPAGTGRCVPRAGAHEEVCLARRGFGARVTDQPVCPARAPGGARPAPVTRHRDPAASPLSAPASRSARAPG